jgi:hypothetical protein
MCVFIGVITHTYISICICTVFLTKVNNCLLSRFVCPISGTCGTLQSSHRPIINAASAPSIFVSESDKDPTSPADPQLLLQPSLRLRRALPAGRWSPPQPPTACSRHPSINTSDRDSAKPSPRIPPPISPSPSPSLSTSSPPRPPPLSTLHALHVAMDTP